MKKLLLLPLFLALILSGCSKFDKTSDIQLGEDKSTVAGTGVTILGQILDLSGAYSTDITGFTVGFELDPPEDSKITSEDVTQSGPFFAFTPDVAGEYYFYAWVYLNADPSNIGVDVVKITVTAPSS